MSEENGKAAAIEELRRRADSTDDSIKDLHGRVSTLRSEFERLVGQLIMLKWVIGGGVLLMFAERFIK